MCAKNFANLLRHLIICLLGFGLHTCMWTEPHATSFLKFGGIASNGCKKVWITSHRLLPKFGMHKECGSCKIFGIVMLSGNRWYTTLFLHVVPCYEHFQQNVAYCCKVETMFCCNIESSAYAQLSFKLHVHLFTWEWKVQPQDFSFFKFSNNFLLIVYLWMYFLKFNCLIKYCIIVK